VLTPLKLWQIRLKCPCQAQFILEEAMSLWVFSVSTSIAKKRQLRWNALAYVWAERQWQRGKGFYIDWRRKRKNQVKLLKNQYQWWNKSKARRFTICSSNIIRPTSNFKTTMAETTGNGAIIGVGVGGLEEGVGGSEAAFLLTIEEIRCQRYITFSSWLTLLPKICVCPCQVLGE